jgi:Phage tail assembly chaperone proteins, E, or 41 or 14
MKLTLKHPLTIGKTTLTELTFRDYATAEDFLAFDERGAQLQTITLIANLTGTDIELIKRLRIDDFRAADKLAGDLLKPEATEKNVVES